MKVVLSSFAKVGTQTVAESLKKKFPYEHTQSMIRIREMMKEKDQVFFCGVRDFVSRNMSYFFQIMHDPSYNNVQCSNNHFKGESCFLGSRREIEVMSTDELIDVFWSNINHLTARIWFLDFFDLMGFDIKKEAFPKDVGYKLYEVENGNYLMLYRLDSTDSMIKANPALFGRLRNKNIGSGKWYAGKYADFKKKIEFGREYVEDQVDNEVMRFFYTKDEINKFKRIYGILGK